MAKPTHPSPSTPLSPPPSHPQPPPPKALLHAGFLLHGQRPADGPHLARARQRRACACELRAAATARARGPPGLRGPSLQPAGRGFCLGPAVVRFKPRSPWPQPAPAPACPPDHVCLQHRPPAVEHPRVPQQPGAALPRQGARAATGRGEGSVGTEGRRLLQQSPAAASPPPASAPSLPTPAPAPQTPPQVTSVYMHIAPAIVSWTLRWHPDAARFGASSGGGAAGAAELVLAPVPVYGEAGRGGWGRRHEGRGWVGLAGPGSGRNARQRMRALLLLMASSAAIPSPTQNPASVLFNPPPPTQSCGLSPITAKYSSSAQSASASGG
jgi:hypothetical protein